MAEDLDSDLEEPVIDDAPEEADVEDTDVEDVDDSDSTEDSVEDNDPDENTLATKTSRGSARIQTLKQRENTAKAEAVASKAEAERLKAQLAEIENRVRSGPTREEIAAEESRIAAMDPADRAIYISQKNAERLQQQLNGLNFQIADNNDRAEFNLLVSKNAAFAKYKDVVEDALSGVRSKGSTAPRRTLLEWAIGKETVEKILKGESGKSVKKAAAARVNLSKGKSLSARGDVGSRGKTDDVESRLRGVVF